MSRCPLPATPVTSPLTSPPCRRSRGVVRLCLGRVAALVLLGTAGLGSASLGAQAPGDAPPPDGLLRVQEAMVDAARAFLASLNAPRLERAHLPFEGDARTTWDYVPGPRAGLPLAEMTGPQRMRTHELLRTALSGAGYLKITSIMQLEEVLRATETAGFPRSVEGYNVVIFGDPSMDAPWGWRFEGHHISLHFTSIEPDALASTPLFLGSNPAEVRQGSWAGLRVLHREEDLARELLHSLAPGQREVAILEGNPPFDILSRNDPAAPELPVEGLPAGEMGSESRLLLIQLLEEYAATVEPAIAEPRLAAIRREGIEHLHFAWMGGTEFGEPHYYRIHGPTVLIEFDNVQGGGNHIHTVWRDLENDFGGDLLRRHYENAPDGHDH